jgi:hypothetical protein
MGKTVSTIKIRILAPGPSAAEELVIKANQYLEGEMRRNGTSFSIVSDTTDAYKGD